MLKIPVSISLIIFLFTVYYFHFVDAGDLYEILEVPKNISNKDLKQHFKKLALQHHPDKNKKKIKTIEDKIKIQNKFKDIVEAMDILGDEIKR